MSDWTVAQRVEVLRAFSAVLPNAGRMMEQGELKKLSTSERRLDAGLALQRSIAGQQVALTIALSERFPFELPHVFIDRGAHPQFLPHVERQGRVCYFESEGVVVRTSKPGEVLEDALALAEKTLEASLSGANALDVYDELEAYWIEHGDGGSHAYIEHDDQVRLLAVGFERRDKKKPASFQYVATAFDDVRAFLADARAVPGEKRGLLVPLCRSVFQEPLDPGQFRDAAWVKDYVARHTSEAVKREITRFGKRSDQFPFVVLSFPRNASGRSLVGLHYEQMSSGHPLLTGKTTQPVRLVALDRRDRATLVARGGAHRKLRNSRVAVIGCGALGGPLALNLAASGIGAIHLVDPDELRAENTFRHPCGRSGIGQSKVNALKTDIEKRYPYVNVSAEPRRAQEAVNDGGLRWTDYELVIVTVGDVVESRRLNEQLAALGVARVFTWIEPLGIGGHAMLVRDPSKAGCYECLFWKDDGAEILHNRSDFAAPGQVFSRSQAGCVGKFTPYGSIDAIRTAELASRLALGALADREQQHPLLSWKGDATDFLARGLILSDRHKLNEAELSACREAYASAHCPVCGGQS